MIFGPELAVQAHGIGGSLGLTCSRVSLASNGGSGQERQGACKHGMTLVVGQRSWGIAAVRGVVSSDTVLGAGARKSQRSSESD